MTDETKQNTIEVTKHGEDPNWRKEQNELKVTDKRIKVPEDQKIDIQGQGVMDVVLVAVQKKYDPELISKLMDLAERREKIEAKKDFFAAMARFKAQCPPIPKDKYNKWFDSWYTSIGKLLETVNPILGSNGLSLDFTEPKTTDKAMSLVGRVSHASGHSELFPMSLPLDEARTGKSGEKSRTPIQDAKSTFTYLRSAIAEAALGISGSEASSFDNDGNSAGQQEEFISEDKVTELANLIAETKMMEGAFLKSLKVETLSELTEQGYKKAISILSSRKNHINKS